MSTSPFPRRNPTTLLSLPPELLTEIILYTPHRTRLALTLVCRQTSELAKDVIYRHVYIGFVGTPREVLRLRTSSIEQSRVQWPSLKVLRALCNPEIADHVRVFDHITAVPPRSDIIADLREDEAMPALNGEIGALHPPLPEMRLPIYTHLFAPEMPKDVQAAEDALLSNALDRLTRSGKLGTVRIVEGVEKVVRPLLDMIFSEEGEMRRFWGENMEDEVLARWVNDMEDAEAKEGKRKETKLEHLRLKKLFHRASGDGDDNPISLQDGKQTVQTSPSSTLSTRFLSFLIPRSPHLRTLCLESIHNLSSISPLLDTLTFPHLTSFQLRTSHDSLSTPPLSSPSIISFLLRHPTLLALSYSSENLIPHPSHPPFFLLTLFPILRNLKFLRLDSPTCSIDTSSGQSRYDPHLLPHASRQLVPNLIALCPNLHTLKLQGDLPPQEALNILAVLPPVLRKLSVISIFLPPRRFFAGLATRTPQLEALKLTSYLEPGVVNLFFEEKGRRRYHVGMPFGDMNENGDGAAEEAMPVGEFVGLIQGLKRLRNLTFPAVHGLDVGDDEVMDIWDSYRVAHNPTRKTATCPCPAASDPDTGLPPMAARVEIHPLPTPEETPLPPSPHPASLFPSPSPLVSPADDAARPPLEQPPSPAASEVEDTVAAWKLAASPPHLAEFLRRKVAARLPALESAKVVFGMGGRSARGWWDGYCFETWFEEVQEMQEEGGCGCEYCKVDWRREEEEEGEEEGLEEFLGRVGIEVKRVDRGEGVRRRVRVRDGEKAPVLQYGWGSNVWTGAVKDLRSRAWFGN